MKLRRSIATVLLTDIVESTEKAAALGDRRWREVLRQHHLCVREQLRRFGGEEIATAGDGFLALFDNPALAMACAAAIRDSVRELGLQLRCGVHMGEVERSDGAVGGIAVNIGARVAAHAGTGEVLVSATVKDAEMGSEFEFEDRGRHELKGIPGTWRLYALTGVPDHAFEVLPETSTKSGLSPWEPVRRAYPSRGATWLKDGLRFDAIPFPAVGKDWWDKIITSKEILEKVKSRKAKEQEEAWHSKRGAHPIFYIDLGDLAAVVRSAQAWVHFKKLFGKQHFFEAIVADLTVSRNIVAHMNPISADDIEQVKAGFKRWKRQLEAKKSELP